MHGEYYEQTGYQQHLCTIAAQVMCVTDAAHVDEGGAQALHIQGYLQCEPKAAYDHLQVHFRALGYTPLLRQEGDGVVVIVLPGNLAAPSRSHFWKPLLMFVLTVVSTILVGGLPNIEPAGSFAETLGLIVQHFELRQGIAFSIAILSILLAHEMGHFLVARHLGVAVSYPFFIPMPLSPVGTMGAVIAMKAPPPDRRALLAIAIAGPLAGLVIAIPVLVLGLWLSNVEPLAYPPSSSPATTVRYLSAAWNHEIPEEPPILEGNSLLYAGLKILVFGHFLPDGHEDVLLAPIAMAGWFGLLVTALNLTPAGQLDGGHILYALVGPRIASITTKIVAVVLFALGFLWVGWFLWALLVVLFGQHHAPLLNDVTPLDYRQKLVAVLGLVVFVLVFTPMPMMVVLPS